MDSDWRQRYEEIKVYIAAHPTIQIDAHVVVIPDDVRPQLFALFDALRIEFITQANPQRLEEALVLSAAYLQAEARVLERLNLKKIEVEVTLGRFLRDPLKGLLPKLFDPLLDLLKNKLDAAAFEKKAAAIVEKYYDNYLGAGYRHWVTLSLIELLEPDEAYTVEVKNEFIDPDLSSAEHYPGMNKEPLSEKVKAESLILDSSLNSAFLAPVVILHSPRFNTYAAIGTGFHEVYRRSMTLSKRVEWMNAESVNRDLGKGYPWPALAVYLHPEADHLRLIADYFNILRPDVMVEIMDKPDWRKTGGIEQLIRHREILKPRLGSLVFCRDTTPEELEQVLPAAPEETLSVVEFAVESELPSEQPESAAAPASEVPADVRIFRVGYDTGELGKLMEVLEAAGAGLHNCKVKDAMDDDGFRTID